MSSSPVDICNRALAKLGDSPILSFSENSTAAKACNALWPSVRDEVYREHPWTSLTKREAWTADATDPTWGFDKRFKLSEASEHVLRVLDVEDEDVWTVEDGYLLVDNAGPINVLYIYRQVDTTVLDSLLVSVLAARMAVELAERLTQSSRKRELAMQEYMSILRSAKRVNAQEGVPTPADEDEWITARN